MKSLNRYSLTEDYFRGYVDSMSDIKKENRVYLIKAYNTIYQRAAVATKALDKKYNENRVLVRDNIAILNMFMEQCDDILRLKTKAIDMDDVIEKSAYYVREIQKMGYSTPSGIANDFQNEIQGEQNETCSAI